MRRNARYTFLLVSLVAVLALGVWTQVERERGLVQQPLTTLDPLAIQHIQVRCSACRTRRFERDAGGWRMLEPYALPADARAIERLLAVAHAPIRSRLSAKDYDLSKLGLAPASIAVTFDGLTIEIGDEDPIEHDRYVLVGGELLRVPDRFSARLLEAPESEVADPQAVPSQVNRP